MSVTRRYYREEVKKLNELPHRKGKRYKHQENQYYIHFRFQDFLSMDKGRYGKYSYICKMQVVILKLFVSPLLDGYEYRLYIWKFMWSVRAFNNGSQTLDVKPLLCAALAVRCDPLHLVGCMLQKCWLPCQYILQPRTYQAEVKYPSEGKIACNILIPADCLPGGNEPKYNKYHGLFEWSLKPAKLTWASPKFLLPPVIGMASGKNNKLGSPLDIKQFEQSQWSLQLLQSKGSSHYGK